MPASLHATKIMWPMLPEGPLNITVGGGGWTMRGHHDVDVIGRLSDP